MNEERQLFFELIRVSIGTQTSLSRLPSEAEWEELFEMAMKQSLLGVCFVGLHTLGADSDDGYFQIGMSEDLFFDWMGIAAQINMKNELVNQQCGEVQQMIEKAGFRTFIMKGQGNAVLYRSSDDLSLFRQSGDIDIFLEGGFKKVNDFVQRTYPTNEINELEIHYHCLEDTEVEIHYKPFIMRNPIKNARLQRFFKETMRFDYKVALPNDAGYINVPTAEFNLVHQMVHIFNHFIYGGVGLRQLMDYYFVMLDASTKGSGALNSSKVQGVVHGLGLDRFASALMWVMQYVFGLDMSLMLWAPDKHDGELLLNEVLTTGNFGHSDSRTEGLMDNKWKSFWYFQGVTFRFMRFDRWGWFWSPMWRIYHFCWRKINGFE